MSAVRVDDVLGADGALARVLPGYEVRAAQLELARAVEVVFERREFLLAEAGTGTGKTLAYLVPALLSGRRVVISTATRALQEQLVERDLPLVRRCLSDQVSVEHLKGRANYLCLQRLESFERRPVLVSEACVSAWPSIADWATWTSRGDRAELDLPETLPLWGRLTSTAESCLGKRCADHERCFVTRARRRAEEAQVIVINHHLLLSDLRLRMSDLGADVGILPDYDAAILDEAHALEDVATRGLGIQVSSATFDALAGDAQAALDPTDLRHGLLVAAGLSLRSRGEAYLASAKVALGLDPEETRRIGPGALEALGASTGGLDEALATLRRLAQDGEEPTLQRLSRRCLELARDLAFLREASSDEHAYWAQGRARGLVLRAAPIEVGKLLRRLLYAQLDTLIVTSATLTVGGRFDYTLTRLGLGPDELPSAVRTLAVGSPFDYARQAGLYLPSHLPDPNDERFTAALADEVVALASLSRGRAFALFTSLRQMEQVHALVRHRLPFQVLLQGERPKGYLLEAFRAEPSVLFASHSFWEGVDVQGDALSLVMIDRLPFAPPQDPLVAARLERIRAEGVDPFGAYQVPKAALALRQGFGRLIRSTTDQGVVAVLDRRITQRSYGRIFLASLPAATLLATRDDVARWFARARER